MNVVKRNQRNITIIRYLCTPTGEINGHTSYPTYEEAAKKFDLAATHISLIKLSMIGKDGPNGERVIPEELKLKGVMQ